MTLMEHMDISMCFSIYMLYQGQLDPLLRDFVLSVGYYINSGM